MEIVKPKHQLVITENYKPSLDDDYINYFNKALSFAQTNYQDRLDHLTKINLLSLTPIIFFKEYMWGVYCSGMNVKTVSIFFPGLLEAISPLYESFRDPGTPISVEKFKKKVLDICPNQKKFNSIIKAADIIRNGIRLFGWECYRDHFLNTPNKLQVLPHIGEINSQHLAKNIGITQFVGGIHLHRLSTRWGFKNSEELCQTIAKYCRLRASVIELILWYSAMTFGTKKSERRYSKV